MNRFDVGRQVVRSFYAVTAANLEVPVPSEGRNPLLLLINQAEADAKRAAELESERDELLRVARDLWGEFREQRGQFGDDRLWQKYEDSQIVEAAQQMFNEVPDVN